MGILDIDGLLPGLLPAAYRGNTFWMPDVSHEVGRRTLVTLFPGIDAAAFDDQGRHDGPIQIRGLVIGDDYVDQALALQAAFQTAGRGTLLHPWLGEISVVIADPAQIRFSDHALRLVQFDVSFFRADVGGAGIFGTLAGLLSAVASLAAIPGQIVSAVIGIGVMAVATWTSVSTMASSIAGLLDTAIAGSAAAPSLTEATLSDRAVLASAVSGAAGASTAKAIATGISAVVQSIGATAIGAEPSAIGAASSTASPAVLGARSGATLLLDLASNITALGAPGAFALGLRLAAEVSVIAEAVRVAAEIDYESRQDASSWRDQLAAAIDGAIDGAAEIALTSPAAAAVARDRLAGVRAALGRDMNEIIGRLPSVYTITPAGPVSAWLIAQHVAGNDPSTVVDTFDDIVRRNRLSHPGLITGPVEVLT